MMNEVFNIQIKQGLEKEIDKLKKIVKFIKKKIRCYRKPHAIKEIHETLEKHPTLSRNSAVTSAREGCDSH